MAKFKAGEICEYWDDGSTGSSGEGWHDCTIKGKWARIGYWEIFVDGDKSHYIDGSWAVHEKYLRKKKPPRQFEPGSWEADIFKAIGWNPTKENNHVD